VRGSPARRRPAIGENPEIARRSAAKPEGGSLSPRRLALPSRWAADARAPEIAARAEEARNESLAGALRLGMTTAYHVLLNARSGSAGEETAELVRTAFAEHGHPATIDADADAPFADRIRRAAESPADVIVAAGGDGTATALAAALVDTGKVLAVLPLGTANLLARDLGLPLDISQWFAALDAMQPRAIDVGEVNGRVFLHKVVIGTVPGIAAVREKLRDQPGIKLGFLRHFVRRLNRSKRLAVEITTSGGDRRVDRVRSIAVSNNDYDEGLGRFFSRSRLDAGHLSVYVLKSLRFGDALRLSAKMLLGRWRQDQAIEIESVLRVSVRMKRPLVKAMLDGEIVDLEMPLDFRIRPAALRVLAPVPIEATKADALPAATAAGA
jgi:diacylglycerol kinase family enzyme